MLYQPLLWDSAYLLGMEEGLGRRIVRWGEWESAWWMRGSWLILSLGEEVIEIFSVWCDVWRNEYGYWRGWTWYWKDWKWQHMELLIWDGSEYVSFVRVDRKIKWNMGHRFLNCDHLSTRHLSACVEWRYTSRTMTFTTNSLTVTTSICCQFGFRGSRQRQFAFVAPQGTRFQIILYCMNRNESPDL